MEGKWCGASGGDNGVRELASGIDGLVKQMRAEQQVVREWIDETGLTAGWKFLQA